MTEKDLILQKAIEWANEYDYSIGGCAPVVYVKALVSELVQTREALARALRKDHIPGVEKMVEHIRALKKELGWEVGGPGEHGWNAAIDAAIDIINRQPTVEPANGCGYWMGDGCAVDAMPSGAKDARELAGKIFDGIALRVDRFFKAKKIQGGVRCGDDIFSPMDRHELAKSIERYVQERASALQGYLDAECVLRREAQARTEQAERKCEEMRKALIDMNASWMCNVEWHDWEPSVKQARAALTEESKP